MKSKGFSEITILPYPCGSRTLNNSIIVPNDALKGTLVWDLELVDTRAIGNPKDVHFSRGFFHGIILGRTINSSLRGPEVSPMILFL